MRSNSRGWMLNHAPLPSLSPFERFASTQCVIERLHFVGTDRDRESMGLPTQPGPGLGELPNWRDGAP